jgi:excisionase family DNA binding protein
MDTSIGLGRASYTVNEIADRNRVHVSTVNRWIASGRIKSIKVGKLRRITVNQEKEFLDKHIQ